MNLTSFLQDKQLTIALRGEIDHHSAKEIMQALAAKVELYLPLVCILDYKDVTFMDSSGIGLVLGRYRLMQELNGKLVLRAMPPHIRRVMRVAGIGSLEIEEESCV